MALIFIAGFDVEVQTSGALHPDNPASNAPNGSVSRDTTVPRSGTGCYKCNSGISGAIASNNGWTFSFAVDTTYYARAYIRFDQLTNSIVPNLRIGGAGQGVSIRSFKTSGSNGQFCLWNEVTNTQIGSNSDVISTGVWYRLELKVTTDASVATTIVSCEARLNGITIASASGLSLTTTSAAVHFGWVNAPGDTNVVCYIDDVKINDSTGSLNNTWPGPGQALLMLPSSDAQRGVWTNGASGTTALWDAVNNIPPVGVAAGSATATSQIKSSSTGSQTLSNGYIAGCGTYVANGAGVNDIVNGVVVWACHGEEVSPGTKTISLTSQNNPTDLTGVSATVGADAGAAGTYPSQWTWSKFLKELSTIDVNSALNLEVWRTDGGSRLADVCFLGAYADVQQRSSLVFYERRRNILVRR